MTIADNFVVSFHYTLTNDDGETLDSSVGAEPLTYLHGSPGIIAGLEKAMVGKATGDHFKVTVSPEEGYGLTNPDLIQKVPLSAFGDAKEIEAGMQFQGQNAEGGTQVITVLEVGEEEVTIDGNHPMANQTLHFEIKIESVREGSAEEIEHGHVHDGNSHH